MIQDDHWAKTMWPAVKALYDDPNSLNLPPPKPLTRRQKIKLVKFETIWRIKVAFDVLRHGDNSKHLDQY